MTTDTTQKTPSKQEEIREGITKILQQPLLIGWQGDALGTIEQGFKNQVSQILSYLHSKGYMSREAFAQQISGYFSNKFEKMVCGAIQDTINTHGTINELTKASLAKRITSQIVQVIKQA